MAVAARDLRPPGGGHAGQRGPVVNPIWPLLATMLGGVWLGWSWFAVNGQFLGGDRLRRQRVTLLVGLAGSTALAVLIMALVRMGVLELHAVKYAAILLTAWKLGVSYLLLVEQQRDFQLFEYYGGTARAGHVLAFAGIFLRGFVLDAIPFGWWTLVLS